MSDTVLKIEKSTIDINLILDRINKHTAGEIQRMTEGEEHGKAGS